MVLIQPSIPAVTALPAAMINCRVWHSFIHSSISIKVQPFLTGNQLSQGCRLRKHLTCIKERMEIPRPASFVSLV